MSEPEKSPPQAPEQGQKDDQSQEPTSKVPEAQDEKATPDTQDTQQSAEADKSKAKAQKPSKNNKKSKKNIKQQNRQRPTAQQHRQDNKPKSDGQQANQGHNNESDAQKQNPDQKPRGVPLRACGNCGMTWKWVHYCPAEDQTCQACGRTGHFAQVCRSTGVSQICNANWRRNNNNNNNRRRDGRGDSQNKSQQQNQNTNEGQDSRNSEPNCNGDNNNDETSQNGEDSSENVPKKFNNNSKNFNNNRNNNNRRWNNQENNTNRNNQRWNKQNRNFNGNQFRNNKKFDNQTEESADGGERQCNDNNMSHHNTFKNPNDDSRENGVPRPFNRLNQNNNRFNNRNNNRFNNRNNDNNCNNNSNGEGNWRNREGNLWRNGNGDNKRNRQDNRESQNNNRSASDENADCRENREKSPENDDKEAFNDGDTKETRRESVYPSSIGQSRYNPREKGDSNYDKSNQYSGDGKAKLNGNSNANRNNNNNNKTSNGSSEYYQKAQRQYDSLGLKKKLAHSFYKQGKYDAALSHYSRLIEMCPTDPTNHNNRCACYMMLQRYDEAFADANKVIQLDSSNVKGYCRLIKCSIVLGYTVSVSFYLTKLSQIDPKNGDLAAERRKLQELERNVRNEKTAVKNKDFKTALDCINTCLRISPYSQLFKTKKAEYLAILNRHAEAQKILDELLKKDPNNVEAKYVAGIRIYYTNIDESVAYFKSILRFDPDHAKVLEFYKKAKKIIDKKEEGNLVFGLKKFSEAHKIYSSILEIDPNHTDIRMKMYYNMGQASHNLGNFERAVQEYTESLKVNPSSVKALKRRGKCYMEMKEWEEAIADFTRVCNLDPGNDCQPLIQEAEKLLLTVKKDHFDILGVGRDATPDDVKKAYRLKALLHHPDRHSNDTVEQRKKHERKFKEITSAYRYLLERCKKNIKFTPTDPFNPFNV